MLDQGVTLHDPYPPSTEELIADFMERSIMAQLDARMRLMFPDWDPDEKTTFPEPRKTDWKYGQPIIRHDVF